MNLDRSCDIQVARTMWYFNIIIKQKRAKCRCMIVISILHHVTWYDMSWISCDMIKSSCFQAPNPHVISRITRIHTICNEDHVAWTWSDTKRLRYQIRNCQMKLVTIRRLTHETVKSSWLQAPNPRFISHTTLSNMICHVIWTLYGTRYITYQVSYHMVARITFSIT